MFWSSVVSFPGRPKCYQNLYKVKLLPTIFFIYINNTPHNSGLSFLTFALLCLTEGLSKYISKPRGKLEGNKAMAELLPMLQIQGGHQTFGLWSAAGQDKNWNTYVLLSVELTRLLLLSQFQKVLKSLVMWRLFKANISLDQQFIQRQRLTRLFKTFLSILPWCHYTKALPFWTPYNTC